MGMEIAICRHCGHEWGYRVIKPARCARCKRRTWTGEGKKRGRPRKTTVAASGTPQKAIVRQERVIPEMSPKAERPHREPRATAEGVKELAYERDEY